MNHPPTPDGSPNPAPYPQNQYPYPPAGQPLQVPPYAQARPTNGPGRLLSGLGLLLISVAATGFAYALPTFSTLQMSMESGNRLFGADPEPVGMDNYELVFSDDRFVDSLALLAVPVLVTILAGAVIAPLVAWCLHLAGAGTRMAARLAWSLPVVAFAPAAMTLAWYADRMGQQGLPDSGLLDWTTLISGLVLGAGVLVALAAFRAGTAGGKPAPAVLTAAGLTAITLAAVGLQTYTFSGLVALPDDQTTPLGLVFETAFRLAESGAAGAISTLLLAALAVLGLGAALLFILARTRLEFSPPPKGMDHPGEPRRFHPAWGTIGLVLLALLVAGTVLNLWPWLTNLTNSPPDDASLNATEVTLRTWVPALLTTLIAVVTALAGGFAIGALRPLGDGSRWLLLLFAPWLFVGTGPLVVANYQALSDADAIGTYVARLPPAWVAIPALFVFTALFWGLEDRRRRMMAEGYPGSKANAAFAGAAWPMAGLATMFIWLANAQDVLWPLVVDFGSEPGVLQTMLRAFNRFLSWEELGIGLGYPIVMLALFGAVMVLASIFYLPKLALRVGR